MRVAGHKTTTFWGWVAIFGALVITILVTQAANLASVWQTAATYTVIIFMCLIVALRPAWGRPKFWMALVVALALHMLVVLSAIREFPRTSEEFHGIPMIASGFLEGLLILGFLWRASTEKSSRT